VLVDAVLEDPETAPITPAERTLLAFVRAVNSRSSELSAEELEPVRAAGWTDEAIYDAVSVCALFNFYNRWCDGTGVNAMPPEGHLASGKRLAQSGYAPPEK
jgi:alkylhydroperoxidase family enzyme